MDLTTLARVKQLIELDGQVLAAGTTHPINVWIGRQITFWSEQAERYLNRTVAVGTYTAYEDVERGQQVFDLKAFPVSGISEIRHDLDRDWTGATISSDEYSLVTGNGEILFDDYPLSVGRGVLRIIYRGGMATGDSASAFASAYPDIADAIDTQVAYAFERKSSLGRQSVRDGSANVTYFQGSIDWLPMVVQVLDRHRRHAYG